jgi:hypothetical protein
MTRGFLDYVKSKNLPLDFFSFHFYTDNVEEVVSAMDFYRQELTSRGFNNVELHVTEYNTETMDVAHKAGVLGSALNTAFWITMQDKGISIATFYRGNDPDITEPSFYGLLFADGRPKKTGLAFRLWSELYALSNRLTHTVSGNSSGLYFLAAQDANGNIGALITNLSTSPKTWTVNHPTMNLNSLTKTLKTVSNASDDIVTTTPSSLEITIGPNTVQLLILQPITLSVSKAGTGSGTVTSNPSGINCGSTCSAQFNSGTQVTLTATAASGSTFAGWSGACSGTSNTCTVTMNTAKSVTATLNSESSQCTYTISVSPQTFSGSAGTGIVTLTPSTSNCTAGWNIQSNSSWLKFTHTCTTGICTGNTASGIGGGTASFRVDANSGTSQRTGMISLTGGNSITITQGAMGSCTQCGIGFTDVPTSSYAFNDILAIGCAGITQGCWVNLYCPSQNVSRAQMAAFLYRAFLRQSCGG